MKDNNPWEMQESPWKTEAAFYAWVRGQLRRGWSRHPVKHLYLKQNRYKKENARGKMTWHLTCEQCELAAPQTQIEIDHIVPAGSFTCKEDIQGFVERLYFVTFDTIRAVCKECHGILTHQERHGIKSFFEANVDKQVVSIMKRPAATVKNLVEEYGYTYLTPKEKNRKNVRIIVTQSESGGYL